MDRNQAEDIPATGLKTEFPSSPSTIEPLEIAGRESGGEMISDRWCLLGIVSVVFLTYGICLTSTIAFSDDYMLLWRMLGDKREAMREVTPHGRAIAGLILTAGFFPVDSIERLWIPRLLSICGMSVLLGLLFTKLRQFGYTRYFAFAFAALAVFLPSFSMYAVWATACFHVFAGIASLCAFSLAERALAARTWIGQGIRAIAALGLMVLALHTYQPTAMFYVVVVLFMLWSPNGPSPDGWRRLAFHLAIVILSLGIAFLVHLAYATTDRGRLDFEVAKGAWWFLTEPFAFSLPLIFFPGEIGVTPNLWWAALLIFVVTMLGYGLYLLREGTPQSRFLKIAVAFALLPLVYLPELVVQERVASYRTRGALAAAVLFLACCAICGLAGHLRTGRRWLSLAKPFVLIATLVLGSNLAQHHVVDYFIVPCQLEWRLIREEMTALNLSHQEPLKEVFFLQPSRLFPVTRSLEYDEFGNVAIARPWVPQAICGLALGEVAPNRVAAFRRAQFHMLPIGDAPPPAAKGQWVVNGRLINGLSDALSEIVTSAQKNGQSSAYEEIFKMKDVYYPTRDRLEQEIADLDQIIEEYPNDARAYAKRGDAYNRLGELARALPDFSRAIELNLKSGEIYFRRGTVHLLLGHVDEAIDDFSKAIELEPRDARAYANRAVCWFKKRQPDRARADAVASEKLGGEPASSFLKTLQEASP